MTRDTLTDNFIGAIQAEPSQHPLTFENPYAGGHTLACLATHDSLLSHVVLFGVFYATFISRPCKIHPTAQANLFTAFFLAPFAAASAVASIQSCANKGVKKPFRPRRTMALSSQQML